MQGATCTCVGLKIARSPCPSVTRLFVLFVYCTATCRPKWRSDAVPLRCASISTTSAFCFVFCCDLLFSIWFEWMADSPFSGHSRNQFFFPILFCIFIIRFPSFPASSQAAVLKCTKLSQCLCRPEQLTDFPRFLQARFYQHPWCTAVASPPCWFFFSSWHHHLSLHHCDTADLTWRVSRISTRPCNENQRWQSLINHWGGGLKCCWACCSGSWWTIEEEESRLLHRINVNFGSALGPGCTWEAAVILYRSVKLPRRLESGNTATIMLTSLQCTVTTWCVKEL